ncbi:MAG: metallophosphoesterase [Acidaminobacteraceae bacterium]
MNKTKLKVVLAATLILASISIFDNKRLTTTYYHINNEKIPSEFNDFKILQISDFHNTDFPEFIYKTKDTSNKSLYNPKLIDYINSENPDIIVITGDTVDSRTPNEDIATDLISNIVDKYPVYYVSGNHEERSGNAKYYRGKFKEMGVITLANQSVELIKSTSVITISGVNDYVSFRNYLEYNHTLSNLKSDNFNILLSHRPEHFEIYAEIGYDLIFSGHAHGGQIRLPFIGGILAPDQGFFPEYDAGFAVKDDSTIIVSRGLGNSAFPLRINNPPEIVVITLNPSKIK